MEPKKNEGFVRCKDIFGERFKLIRPAEMDKLQELGWAIYDIIVNTTEKNRQLYKRHSNFAKIEQNITIMQQELTKQRDKLASVAGIVFEELKRRQKTTIFNTKNGIVERYTVSLKTDDIHDYDLVPIVHGLGDLSEHNPPRGEDVDADVFGDEELSLGKIDNRIFLAVDRNYGVSAFPSECDALALLTCAFALRRVVISENLTL
jgi:hypothetical protein